MVPGTSLGSVTAIGSGARSELWMQIKADVLQAAYQSLHRSDLSTLGSAMLAGLSVGLFSGAEEVTRRFVSVKKRVEPVPGEDAKYMKYVRVYEGLFRSLADTYRRLAS
jgi:xylulokinase